MDQRIARFAGCVALAVLAAGLLLVRADGFGLAAGHAERVHFDGAGVPVVVAGVAPEPSGVALLGLAMLGVAAIVRRRVP
jgi:hypothetical protein